MACSSLASAATSANDRRSPELAPQRGERRLGGRIHEQRAHVVEELVADGAGNRPVAQRLGGLEDLLDPYRLGSAVAQAPKYWAGSASPSG